LRRNALPKPAGKAPKQRINTSAAQRVADKAQLMHADMHKAALTI
jgi:hypothetical protein